MNTRGGAVENPMKGQTMPPSDRGQQRPSEQLFGLLSGLPQQLQQMSGGNRNDDRIIQFATAAEPMCTDVFGQLGMDPDRIPNSKHLQTWRAILPDGADDAALLLDRLTEVSQRPLERVPGDQHGNIDPVLGGAAESLREIFRDTGISLPASSRAEQYAEQGRQPGSTLRSGTLRRGTYED